MLAAYAPAVLQILARRRSCIATTCLSNIGDPSKRFTADLPREEGRIVAGNLTLEDIRGVPPIRQRHPRHVGRFLLPPQADDLRPLRPVPVYQSRKRRIFVEMYRDGLLSHALELHIASIVVS